MLTNAFSNYLNQATIWHQSDIPESSKPIFYAEKKLKPYIENKLTKENAQKILNEFKPTFSIELNHQGFAQAAERKKENDVTNYHAIWVRDSIWVYYYFKIFAPEKAKTLLKSLINYYLSDLQQKRFHTIINNPKLKLDPMSVPHIRFDGDDSNYQDIQIDGKDQIWNHKQLDAHGLFLLALADAFESNLFTQTQLTKEIQKLVNLFFAFFACIDYSNYEDAGAWEEIERLNTSSIALVANACDKWQKLACIFHFSIKTDLENLKTQGIKRVIEQINLGGESPKYRLDDLKYRTNDAALLHVLVPWHLEGLALSDYQKMLHSVSQLERTHGVIRYENDSYQAANFWLNVKENQISQLTDDTSDLQSFSLRFANMIEHSEAQWFFDSLIALSHLKLFKRFPLSFDPNEISNICAYHIKRALAQMTTDQMLTSDGNSVKGNLLPESINTVIFDQKRYFLPSPITPLNWAKASLAIALFEFGQCFN